MAIETRQRWGIVGGGILGMTLARLLARAGKDVTLFEEADVLGGLAAPWEIGGVAWDRHYHVILLSDDYLRNFFAEMGLEKEIRWVETQTGFFSGGKLYSMSNTLEFLRFPPLGPLDKIRLGANIFYASKVKDWRRLENILVSDWLTRWSGRSTFEKIWLPLLRAKLGENWRKASAAFIWAIIARMYAARRSGLKKEMFGYVPGGYARILRRFEEELERDAVNIRLRHVVRGVERTGNGVHVSCENGYAESFDRVVLTMASPIASAICPGLEEGERNKHLDIQYQGILCASLLLKKPLAGFYVTNITDDGIPFTAVIEMSALVDREQFGGNSLVYLPKYVPAGSVEFLLTDQELEESFVGALLKMYPHLERSDVLAFRVSRVPFVLAVSTLDYSRRLPPVKTNLDGVYIMNSTHIINGTLNVNETLSLAERFMDMLPPARETGLYVKG